MNNEEKVEHFSINSTLSENSNRIFKFNPIRTFVKKKSHVKYPNEIYGSNSS